ncbi:MAG: Ig domain-containing protein [Paludibacteraceae bacterium]|nr:Ig domain-containing protein [Paludibacteraceae bacterium]
MKKFFSLFAAVLFAGSMFAVDFTLSSADAVTVEGVTVTFAKGSGSNAPAWYPAGLRLYANNTVTVSSESKITAITFNWEKQGSKAFNTATASEGSYTHPEAAGEGKWTGSANSVTFTIGASGQLQLNTLSVTIDEGSFTPVEATGISLDKTSLTLTEGETATLTATLTPEGATTAVTWTSSDEKVATVSNGKVTAEGAGTATITATAGTFSATCDVTINAAPVLTCAQANALANGANAKLGEFTVAYANGANTYIKDASGYALIFKYDFGLKAGDVVTGFKGSMNIYYGLPELVPSVTLADLTVTPGEAPAPEEFIAAPVAADVNKYIVLRGVTMTAASFTNKNLTATIGDVNFTLRDNFSTSQTFDTEKTYDVVGAVAIYNGNVQVYFISATEQVTTDPFVEAMPDDMEFSADAYEGNTITLTYENWGDAVPTVTAATEAAWITNIALNDDNSKLTFDVAANDGAARTATITVTATAGEIVKTATITVSQIKKPVPTGSFELFTGELVEDDYVIYYDGRAMKAEVASDRLQYDEVTPEDNKIEDPADAVIWHIAKSGDYWTVYNELEEKYAASTGAKNKAQLTATLDDKALWTVTKDENGAFEFVNKQNTANGVNANLRNNTTYGFACYATATGGALSLYKKSNGSATAISNTAVETKAVKTLRNGILVIEKAGVRYNVMGQIIR